MSTEKIQKEAEKTTETINKILQKKKIFLKTAPINRKIWKNTKEAQIINMKNKGAPISTDSTNVKK